MKVYIDVKNFRLQITHFVERGFAKDERNKFIVLTVGCCAEIMHSVTARRALLYNPNSARN